MAKHLTAEQEPFPHRKCTQEALIHLIWEHGGTIYLQTPGHKVYEELGKRLGVSPEAQRRLPPSGGKQTAWSREVGFCVQNLREDKERVIHTVKEKGRGVWALTDHGRDLARSSILTPTVLLPDEANSERSFWEGAVTSVLVNKYERDPDARKACIAHYGLNCRVCQRNFGLEYGPLAEGLIHVHHLMPLADIREGYIVDPVKHLRPVCPNCHAVIHWNGFRTIEDVQRLLESRRK